VLVIQARCQDLAAGGAKTRKGGHILKILYWMYAATRGTNVKWGGTDSKWGAGHHWIPRWRRPCGHITCSSAVAATCGALIITSLVVRKPSEIFGLAVWRAGKPLHKQNKASCGQHLQGVIFCTDTSKIDQECT